MADKTTTLKTKTNDNVYPNVIGDNRKNAFVDSSTIKHHFYDQTHKVGFQIANETNIKIQNSLQKPAGLTKTKLVGVGTNGQENIEIGDNLTLANGKLSATGGSSGGEGGISVIELTDKNGTIASTQLSEINANPQNFTFKYNGKILLFTKADSTTYQYCNNTTSSSDNNVMTTSTLLTITSSTGAYTIAENVHNVVANSIHPANGGDLTNIQVGSKVYSIPSGGGGVTYKSDILRISKYIDEKQYNLGDDITLTEIIKDSSTLVVGAAFLESNVFKNLGGEAGPTFIGYIDYEADPNATTQTITLRLVCIKSGTTTEPQQIYSGIGLTLITNATII